MKRKLVFQFDDNSNLSIRIECAHGSLYAMNWNGEDSIVATRYMVEELRRDKDAMRAFDIEFIEPE
jgi:hypothetical protein